MDKKKCPFFIVILLAVCVFGCNDSATDSDGLTAARGQEVPRTQPKEERTVQRTVSELRTKFPGKILDAEWKTLKKVLNAAAYLTFLVPDRAFQSFDEFLLKTPPPPQRYEAFLKQAIKIAEETDVSILHAITLATLKSKARKYHDLPDTDSPLIKVLASQDVRFWMQLRFRKADQFDSDAWVQFVIQHRLFVNKLEEEHRSKLQQLFSQKGQDRGILQFALEDPFTMEQLLSDFTEVEVFLKWVNGDFKDK